MEPTPQSRDSLLRRSARVRRSLIAASVAGSTGIASYLGLSTTASATAVTGDPVVQQGPTVNGQADLGWQPGAPSFGPGQGSPHATTRGS